jgi:hypothetical protein
VSSLPDKADLFDRAEERALIDAVLSQARAGTSGVLLITGEPGLGKTALLEYAAGAARDLQPDLRVVRVSGAEAEMELAFAGLHQLCAPFLPVLAELPGPQRTALETAFGLGTGVLPDPFFVGLGVLGLLSASATRRPLLCLVDDVQWLDQPSARALAFVARRLDADAVALIVSRREARMAKLNGRCHAHQPFHRRNFCFIRIYAEVAGRLPDFDRIAGVVGCRDEQQQLRVIGKRVHPGPVQLF